MSSSPLSNKLPDKGQFDLTERQWTVDDLKNVHLSVDQQTQTIAFAKIAEGRSRLGDVRKFISSKISSHAPVQTEIYKIALNVLAKVLTSGAEIEKLNKLQNMKANLEAIAVANPAIKSSYKSLIDTVQNQIEALEEKIKETEEKKATVEKRIEKGETESIAKKYKADSNAVATFDEANKEMQNQLKDMKEAIRRYDADPMPQPGSFKKILEELHDMLSKSEQNNKMVSDAKVDWKQDETKPYPNNLELQKEIKETINQLEKYHNFQLKIELSLNSIKNGEFSLREKIGNLNRLLDNIEHIVENSKEGLNLKYSALEKKIEESITEMRNKEKEEQKTQLEKRIAYKENSIAGLRGKNAFVEACNKFLKILGFSFSSQTQIEGIQKEIESLRAELEELDKKAAIQEKIEQPIEMEIQEQKKAPLTEERELKQEEEVKEELKQEEVSEELKEEKQSIINSPVPGEEEGFESIEAPKTVEIGNSIFEGKEISRDEMIDHLKKALVPGQSALDKKTSEQLDAIIQFLFMPSIPIERITITPEGEMRIKFKGDGGVVTGQTEGKEAKYEVNRLISLPVTVPSLKVTLPNPCVIKVQDNRVKFTEGALSVDGDFSTLKSVANFFKVQIPDTPLLLSSFGIVKKQEKGKEKNKLLVNSEEEMSLNTMMNVIKMLGDVKTTWT